MKQKPAAPSTSTEKLYFVIQGNPDSKEGNAIPKLKKTGGQHWTPAAKRYVAWKHYIVGMLLDQVRGGPWEALIIRNIGIYGKPVTTKIDRPARMDLMIHWADNTHGDPENIFGSIADALFKQDKYLKGSFDFVHDGKGIVEVTITL